jgi:hypothetical protein
MVRLGFHFVVKAKGFANVSQMVLECNFRWCHRKCHDSQFSYSLFLKQKWSSDDWHSCISIMISLSTCSNSKFMHIDSAWFHFRWSDQIWSNLIKSDQIWSNLIKCMVLIRFDQIWSDLIRFDQIWSADSFFISMMNFIIKHPLEG